MRAKGFRLKKLISNLQLVVKRIGYEDLSVTTKELYVFGSVLRKKRPRDIDVVAIYAMNDEQNERWSNFYQNLSKALNDIWNKFNHDVPFSEIVADNSEYFVNMAIEPNWASSLSWSDLYNFGWNPLWINWQVLVRKKITKGMKGVHVQFAQSLTQFEDTERFLLVWSPEKPDIQANLTAPEPRLRALAAENVLLRKELQDETEKAEIFSTLYTKTRGLVEELTNVFEEDVYGYTFDDVLTLRTILSIPKRRVKEERIREILKECGLPADKIEKVGSRTYNIKEA